MGKNHCLISRNHTVNRTVLKQEHAVVLKTWFPRHLGRRSGVYSPHRLKPRLQWALVPVELFAFIHVCLLVFWKRSHPWVVAQRGCWEPNFPLDVDASGSQTTCIPKYVNCWHMPSECENSRIKTKIKNIRKSSITLRAFTRPARKPHKNKRLLYFEWSPPWHFKTATIVFFVSLISCQVGVVRHTAYLLKCVRLLSTSQTDCRTSSDIHSDIMSGRSSDILSDISSDIIFGISPCHSVWLTFFLAILPAYLLAFFLTFSMASLLTFRLAYFLAFCLTFFRWGTTTCWTKNICGSPETAPVELVKKSYPLAN